MGYKHDWFPYLLWSPKRADLPYSLTAALEKTPAIMNSTQSLSDYFDSLYRATIKTGLTLVILYFSIVGVYYCAELLVFSVERLFDTGLFSGEVVGEIVLSFLGLLVCLSFSWAVTRLVFKSLKSFAATRSGEAIIREVSVPLICIVATVIAMAFYFGKNKQTLLCEARFSTRVISAKVTEVRCFEPDFELFCANSSYATIGNKTHCEAGSAGEFAIIDNSGTNN